MIYISSSYFRTFIMHVFVTVGTTKFDKLVQSILSYEVQCCLSDLGYTSLTIQTGKFPSDLLENLQAGPLEIETYQYKPSLAQDISAADLVISHAGAGTCIEVLEAAKPLIVIVNDDLMDNHQIELAEKLAQEEYLLYGTVTTLTKTLQTFKTVKLKPYPIPDTSVFSSFVDKVMRVC